MRQLLQANAHRLRVVHHVACQFFTAATNLDKARAPSLTDPLDPPRANWVSDGR